MMAHVREHMFRLMPMVTRSRMKNKTQPDNSGETKIAAERKSKDIAIPDAARIERISEH